jgi:hypothetical protein
LELTIEDRSGEEHGIRVFGKELGRKERARMKERD